MIATAWHPHGCDSSSLAWVSVACGLGAITWDVLDNMDGPQARRTKTAGILGDYLDHMLDYISLACVVYGTLWSINLGRDPLGLIMSAAALAAHGAAVYLVWWGRRFTRCVALPLISQDEVVVISASFMFYTASVPIETWAEPCAPWGFAPFGVVLSRGQFITFCLLIFLGVGNPVLSIIETLTHHAFPSGERAEALYELWPLISFFLALASSIAYLVHAQAPLPSIAVSSLAVASVCWPLSALQLLSSIAGRAPSNTVCAALATWPIVMTAAHLLIPSYGLLATALAMHAVTTAAICHFVPVLMRRVQCPSLWVIPQEGAMV